MMQEAGRAGEGDVSLKRRLAFNGLYGVISQKKNFSETTTV
jgi:hypothetical protein